jgi:hypothetical protein
MKCRIALLLAAPLLLGASHGNQQSSPSTATPGAVDGRITNSQTGEPVTGANVHLYPQVVQGGTSSSLSTGTHLDGGFRFDSVSPGSYFVIAEQSAYTSSGPVLTIRVHEGEQVSNISLQLNPLATITGKVVSDDAAPIPDVQVTIYTTYDWRGHPQLRPAGSATTDKDGVFQLRQIRPGRYFLAADPNRGKAVENRPRDGQDQNGQSQDYTLARTFYPDSSSLDGATTLDITPGQNAAGTIIQLKRTALHYVQGRIENLDPSEASDARVSLAPRGSLPMAGLATTVKAAKDGSFTIHHVEPGSYTLWLTSTSDQGMGGSRRQKLMARQNIDVSAMDVTDVVLSVSPPISLTGKVTLASGPAQGLAQIWVAFVPAGEAMFGSYRNVAVDRDGAFVVPELDPGEYKLVVQGAPPGSYVQSVQYNRQDAMINGIDLAEGGGGEVDVVLRMGAGEIDGTVQVAFSDIPRIGGVGVLIPDQVAVDGSGTLIGSISPAGHFVIRNVPPGHYSVVVTARWSSVWQNASFLREVARQGASIDVQENTHVQVEAPIIPEQDTQQTAYRLGLSSE